MACYSKRTRVRICTRPCFVLPDRPSRGVPSNVTCRDTCHQPEFASAGRAQENRPRNRNRNRNRKGVIEEESEDDNFALSARINCVSLTEVEPATPKMRLEEKYSPSPRPSPPGEGESRTAPGNSHALWFGIAS